MQRTCHVRLSSNPEATLSVVILQVSPAKLSYCVYFKVKWVVPLLQDRKSKGKSKGYEPAKGCKSVSTCDNIANFYFCLLGKLVMKEYFFELFKESKNFAAAEASCRSKGGYVASVRDMGDLDKILALMEKYAFFRKQNYY